MLTITKTQQAPKGGDLHPKKSGVPAWAWTALGCIVLSVLAYAFVVSPQWNRVGPGKQIDLAAAQQDVSSREHYLNQLQELQRNYQAIDQASVDLLSRMIPRGKGTPELLHQLEAIAKQSGVNLTDVNISEVQQDVKKGTAAQRAAAAQKKSDVKQLLVQLQVSAYDYRSFRSFLEAMQSHTRLLDVENYVYTTEKPIQQITLRTYYIE